MSQSFHLHIRVKTFLEMTAFDFYSGWHGAVTDDSGRFLSYQEMKAAMTEEMEKGRVVIPMGKCNHFDYSGRGCLGHQENEVENESR